MPDDHDTADSVLPLGDPSWELQQAARVSFCERPIFLVGRDKSGVTRHVVAIRCKARQASQCVPCSRAFQLDARRLVRLGFVEERRCLPDVRWWWLTLTAPGVELTGAPVHTRRSGANGGRAPCGSGRCFACDRPAPCRRRHEAGDPSLGAPLEGHEDCFRYWAIVRWNWNVPALWDQTTAYLRSNLRGRPWTLQSAKVVQWQARGAVHIHAVLRTTASADLLHEAIAAARVQGWGWGRQVKLERLTPAGAETTAKSAQAIASRINYLCRYATRDVRVLLPRASDGPLARHIDRLCQQAFSLAEERGAPNRERVSRGLGYGGQVLTHSRKWGASFSQLAAERRQFQAARAVTDETDETLVWAVAGSGWQENGSAKELVAAMFADKGPAQVARRNASFLQAVPGEDELSYWDVVGGTP